MREIRKLKKKDIEDFSVIVNNAYPGFKMDVDVIKDKLRKMWSQDENSNFYGMFKNGKLLGGMRCIDYKMNVFSKEIKAGGVGLVAVDLLHKKEKVCKELMEFFLKHYRKKGATFALLYPFRPDFYKKMGFGYGTKMNQFRVKPVNLPRGKTKEHIKFINEDDKDALIDCYTAFMKKTHGMIRRNDFEIEQIFNSKKLKIACYKMKNKIKGYIIFHFKPLKEGNFILNDMIVREFIYEDREVLNELLTFLHTQLDQVSRIIFNTQDDYFHYIFFDPRNDTKNFFGNGYSETNIQGIGIMYRIIDIEKIFKKSTKYGIKTDKFTIKINVKDSFLPDNNGNIVVTFENGSPEIQTKDDFDVEITLDISDFSSLYMGTVNAISLYRYNLLEISEVKYLEEIDKIFRTRQKPVCMTYF